MKKKILLIGSIFFGLLWGGVGTGQVYATTSTAVGTANISFYKGNNTDIPNPNVQCAQEEPVAQGRLPQTNSPKDNRLEEIGMLCVSGASFLFIEHEDFRKHI